MAGTMLLHNAIFDLDIPPTNREASQSADMQDHKVILRLLGFDTGQDRPQGFKSVPCQTAKPELLKTDWTSK